MIYRKRGHVVRWENGTRIRVTESGAARETGPLFECWPEVWTAAAPAAALQLDLPLDASTAPARAAALQAERVIITRGYAEHEYGDHRWSEHTERFHASLTRNGLRVLVDRLEDLDPIARALERAGREREAPRHLRLAPNVTAALLPFLEEARQTAGGVDGYGNAITETSESFYRPSYRMRPVRMRFNLRLEHAVTTIDEDLPSAVALLAPAGGTTLRVLIEDERGVYPASVTVGKIAAVGQDRVWYPYGAGSFGAEMMF